MSSATPVNWPGWKNLGRSFGVTLLFWIVVSTLLTGVFSGLRAAAICLGIGALVAANLISLAGLGRAMLDRPSGRISPFPALFWGGAKLVCLGTLIAVVASAKSYPPLSLVAGFSALIIVPVVGGWVHGSNHAS